MKHIRTLFLASIAWLASSTAHAQQEVMISQYMFNGLFLNPAYAGTHNYASSSLLHRAHGCRSKAPRAPACWRSMRR